MRCCGRSAPERRRIAAGAQHILAQDLRRRLEPLESGCDEKPGAAKFQIDTIPSGKGVEIRQIFKGVEPVLNFQEIILELQKFWMRKGCVLQQPYDLEMGAGTMHPETFLRVLGPEPYSVAYVQPCRRPTDGRYGENPNRMQRYFQFQVILKPSPLEIQNWYLESLLALGIHLIDHDIRFEEDNWESPTLGAFGVGWQVLLDGLEITQLSYFQQAGGLELNPISAEITYGLERIATTIGGVDDVYSIS